VDGEHDVGLGPVEVARVRRDGREECFRTLKDSRNPPSATIADRLGEPVLVPLVIEEQQDLVLLTEGGVVAPLILLTDVEESLQQQGIVRIIIERGGEPDDRASRMAEELVADLNGEGAAEA